MFDRALVIDEIYYEAILGKGIALFHLNDQLAAMLHFDKAISINPNNAEAYLNSGNSLRIQEKFNDALQQYNIAIQKNQVILKPTYAKVNKLLITGNLLNQLKNFKDEIKMYFRATQTYPKQAKAYMQLGIAYKNIGRFDDSIVSLDYALSLGEININASIFLNKGIKILNWKAQSIIDKYLLYDAVSIYDCAIHSNPKKRHILIQSETFQRMRKDVEDSKINALKKACDILDAAIQSNPRLIEAYISKGDVLVQLGRIKEAIKSYDHAIAINPSNMEAYLKKGNAFFQLQQVDKALKMYNIVLQSYPNYRNKSFQFKAILQYSIIRYDDTILILNDLYQIEEQGQKQNG